MLCWTVLERPYAPTSFGALAQHYTYSYTYTPHRYTKDLALLQYKLKVQYAAVMFGVSFGFLLGGFVYKAYYIDGVAIFGIIVLSIEARMLTKCCAKPVITAQR